MISDINDDPQKTSDQSPNVAFEDQLKKYTLTNNKKT